MSTESDVAVATAVVGRVMNQGDLEAVAECFDPGYVEHDVLPPGVPPGLEGMRRLAGMLRGALPDLRYDIEDVVAGGDRVVLRITGHGTMQGPLFGLPATGKAASWNEIHISRIEAGRIVEHWPVTDQLGMLQQLGLAPA
jgi:predicted ester cyclase